MQTYVERQIEIMSHVVLTSFTLDNMMKTKLIIDFIPYNIMKTKLIIDFDEVNN
jgi:hypothetical protein